MIPRFHCPALAAAPGSSVTLPDQAAHHAVRVLRLRVGDAVTLFSGNGEEWQGAIAEAGRDVRVTINASGPGIVEPELEITLVQSLPSGDKMDWIVQKAVELGVSAIQPVTARRSVVKLDGDRARKRNVHWQEVAISACEQSGRNVVPTVLPLLDLNQYFTHARKEEGLRFLLSPEGGRRLRDMEKPAGRISLLIGPEGGFEDGEVDAARSVGFTPLQLGPRVLRTETAGLAALAAMMAVWGDL
ncbi:MAG: 16S rRNA (uracil(1498)-N(3))-methyltransferase [Rhodocyclaceae bacterium]|nr:16S rRNA (uracil(1498)-N(3))-methyltransferase [Rhodocyclaceae bacterium]